jgi:hypothetical protein
MHVLCSDCVWRHCMHVVLLAMPWHAGTRVTALPASVPAPQRTTTLCSIQAPASVLQRVPLPSAPALHSAGHHSDIEPPEPPPSPQVCGDSEAWGDFIVPTSSAHLEGALQVDLEGVFHSPLGAKLPFLGPWYGSEGVVEQWLHHVVGEGEELARTGAGLAAEARSAA